MTKYKTLIFDLDDTLIDNKRAMRYAFRKVLEELNINYSDDLFNEWFIFDKNYWTSYELGKINIPDKFTKTPLDKRLYLRSNRFCLFFKNVDLERAITLNNIFVESLGCDIKEIDGAKETLEYLSEYFKIVIATNGPEKAAELKVSKTELDKYIEFIFCNEKIFYSKPSKEFFDCLFSSIGDEDRSHAIIIGDSIITDIKSGVDNGLDSCWYNPNEIERDKIYVPTMEIKDLRELKKKLFI